jgi:hypothetical protein
VKTLMYNKLGSTLWCFVGAHGHCDGWTRTKSADGSIDLHSCECRACRHAMLARCGVITNHTGVIR